MNRRSVQNLSRDEWLKVYNNSSKLREIVLYEFQENEMFWIGEQLNYIRDSLADYSIGFNCRNFIKIKGEAELEFLEGVEQFHDPNMTREAEKAIRIFESLDDVPLDNDDEYARIEDEAIQQTEKVKELVLEYFDNLTHRWDEKEVFNYFIEVYLDQNIESESYYIDENFILYEDVAYTKSYK